MKIQERVSGGVEIGFFRETQNGPAAGVYLEIGDSSESFAVTFDEPEKLDEIIACFISKRLKVWGKPTTSFDEQGAQFVSIDNDAPLN